MKKKHHETVIHEPIVHEVSDTTLERMDLHAQSDAERLAENTVAWMDTSMESFHFSENATNKNMNWAERRSYVAELAAYDADYQMRSPAGLPKDSPDRRSPEVVPSK